MLVLLWLTVAAPAAAQVVRTSLKPETAVLGQPVRVFVDVLFPGEMPRPPRVALPDMPIGGVRDSGYGYEGGRAGIEAFLHFKLVSTTV